MKRKWYIKRAFAATLVGAVMMLAGCQEGKKSETMANYVTDSLTSRLYDLMSDRPEEALALADEDLYKEKQNRSKKTAKE